MSSLVPLEGRTLSKGSCSSCAGTAGAMCLWEEDYCGREEYCPPRVTEHSWPSSLHFPLELPQVEVTKAYFAKQADEITLQQADVVLVLQEEDGECGWGHP